MNRLLFASGKVIDKPKYHLGKILTLKKGRDPNDWAKELEIVGRHIDGRWIVVATQRMYPDAARTPGPLDIEYLDTYYE
jgi:hypothetical protein